MEIVLREDVTNLGRAGEVVKVKDGYARNYLIPQGLAFPATAGNKKRIEQESARRAGQRAEQESGARELATRLADVSITFKAKAGEGERLFGSITAQDISTRLAEQGFTIDKRTVELAEPIRTLGEHRVPIRLHPSVKAEVQVQVVRE